MKIREGGLPGRGQRGSVIILFALSLFVLIGIGALAIDIGFLHTTRSELQNVADAAALAGARYLGAEYAKLMPSQMGTHAFTHEEVFAVIQAVAQQNEAAKESISINSEDVIIGLWNVEESVDDISPTLVGPDAVRVIARRDSNENGSISTFLARIFNINTMDVVSEKAIAALSGPATVEELKTPFGLSENNFPNNCKPIIAFSPTTDSCAGWHNFFDAINADAMADKLIGLIQGHTDTSIYGLNNGPQWLEDNFNISKTPSPEQTPSTGTGDEFDFQGGTISKLFKGDYLGADYDGNTGTVYSKPDTISNKADSPAPIRALFDYFRYRDGDGDDSVWTATVPVYGDDSEDGCMNPNTSLPVIGFAQIVIYTTDPPPFSSLNVHVDCNLSVIEGRGGGVTYGNLKGTIPNLVK